MPPVCGQYCGKRSLLRSYVRWLRGAAQQTAAATKRKAKNVNMIWWLVWKCLCLLRSIFDMLMVLVFRHWRHHPRDVINFRRLPLLVDTSLPRSISDDRHDELSSKLDPRRWRWKHAQFRNMAVSDCLTRFFGVNREGWRVWWGDAPKTISKISSCLFPSAACSVFADSLCFFFLAPMWFARNLIYVLESLFF